MSYTTPIYDRTAEDITSLTSKAYFNVADWARIYDNAEAAHALVESLLNIIVVFDEVVPPTMETIASVTALNTLLANIERLRLASTLPAIIGLVAIKYTWLAGANEEVPDYSIVNSWEQVIDIIYTSVPRALEYWIPCGVSAAGQPRFYQHRFR